MTRKEKLLEKARRNMAGLLYKDFETLMGQCRWQKDHQTGSHAIWYSPGKYRIAVQNRNGKAKGYQVKQFLAQYDKEQKDAT